MWIFVAEALLALALLIAIVWWTMGPTHKRERQEAKNEANKEASRGVSVEGNGDSAARREND